MMTRILGTLVVVVGCCCAADQMSRPASADERGKKGEAENPKNGGITFEAVLEKIDGNTITARAYHHVILERIDRRDSLLRPPSGRGKGGPVRAAARHARGRDQGQEASARDAGEPDARHDQERGSS
jgi:hypothetical protein